MVYNEKKDRGLCLGLFAFSFGLPLALEPIRFEEMRPFLTARRADADRNAGALLRLMVVYSPFSVLSMGAMIPSLMRMYLIMSS